MTNIIKRTKNGATHYATKIDRAGNVTGWTADKQQAKQFTEEESFTVESFYDALPAGQKANAGIVEPVECTVVTGQKIGVVTGPIVPVVVGADVDDEEDDES